MPHRSALPAFDAVAYRQRKLIERAFCRLKDSRASATRYDKTARNALAGIRLVKACSTAERLYRALGNHLDDASELRVILVSWARTTVLPFEFDPSGATPRSFLITASPSPNRGADR